MEELEERVARIVAILRNEKHHEPNCPGTPVKTYSAMQQEWYLAESGNPCTCWLSEA